MIRIIALLILVIPGMGGVLGIKLIRDALFGVVHPLFPNFVVELIAGILLFLIGFGFVGGFIFYRDRKRNNVQPRFRKKGGNS
ncbi:DUF2627 domain-containing protein [Pseudalkalibacillus berkeleyi]|uniref:DUF2627 domain-containing protein n=1 Tax=Pseudalkalibacillus berkeleyi TaxID=1069813 RepID=A0ABS9H1X6_9BACL|nr:DUF2627 domain-containing protein [Pseudalkalibacillus berkeleyi]MCF6137838.1 DUF2627 domain-containing protein [Pseudalkalibacillus berkeleyi]